MDTMLSPASDLGRAMNHFEDLEGRWVGGPWTWDGRFGCPVSVIRPGDVEDALELVRVVFPFEFGAADQAQLPDELVAVVARSGGLRSGQLAFCDRLPDGSLRYALWWPWGDGVTASLRIGIC